MKWESNEANESAWEIFHFIWKHVLCLILDQVTWPLGYPQFLLRRRPLTDSLTLGRSFSQMSHEWRWERLISVSCLCASEYIGLTSEYSSSTVDASYSLIIISRPGLMTSQPSTSFNELPAKYERRCYHFTSRQRTSAEDVHLYGRSEGELNPWKMNCSVSDWIRTSARLKLKATDKFQFLYSRFHSSRPFA